MGQRKLCYTAQIIHLQMIDPVYSCISTTFLLHRFLSGHYQVSRQTVHQQATCANSSHADQNYPAPSFCHRMGAELGPNTKDQIMLSTEVIQTISCFLYIYT